MFNWATRRWRVACIADDTRSRGAIGLVVLDLGHFAVVSVSAYLTIR